MTSFLVRRLSRQNNEWDKSSDSNVLSEKECTRLIKAFTEKNTLPITCKHLLAKMQGESPTANEESPKLHNYGMVCDAFSCEQSFYMRELMAIV